MKPINVLPIALAAALCWSGTPASAQQSPLNSPSKSAPSPAGRTNAADSSAQDKPEPSAADLIAQGKALFRTAKFRPALAKFEAALKLEGDNDEALGLAAETAFRLDNQTAARDYLLQRAELSGQKESVKAFCNQRAAMTFWREAHDIVAKYAESKDDKIVYRLPDEARGEANEKIEQGVEYANRALELRRDFSDAYNIRNLLYAEGALAATEEEKGKDYIQKSLDDLQMALAMDKPSGKAADAADFNAPTVRFSEFALNKADDEKYESPFAKAVTGGKPIKRVQPSFPSVRPPKATSDPNDPAKKGVTADGGAYSLGTGRGALTAAYAPGKVKVEVLVSTEGKVIFTHIVDGRSDLNGAAIMAARGWTFEPAALDGRPVQVSGVITFDMKPGAARSTTTAAKPPAKKP